MIATPRRRAARCLALGAVDEGVLAQTRHLLHGAAGTAEAAGRGGSARRRADRVPARRRHGGGRERVRAGPGRRARGARRGARRRARHRGRRVQAPAAVPLGGRADPPRRGRRSRDVHRVRGGAARRGRPADGALEGRPAAGRARDRGRRAGRGRVRGPADGRAAGAAARGRPRRCDNAYAPYSEFKVGAAVRGAERRDLLPARTSRTSPIPRGMRRGLRARGADHRRRDRDHRGGGGRRAPRGLPAVRWLPPAAGRVRRRFDAGVPRRRGPTDDAGRAAARRVRVARALGREPGHRRASASCSGRASARSPTRSRTRSWSATRSCPAFRARASRATPGGPCWARSAACRSRCSRVARTCTKAARSTRCALRSARCEPRAPSVLVLTNAAGSLRPEVGPGSLMAITDHINMTGVNLLAGPNDDVDRAAVPVSCATPTTRRCSPSLRASARRGRGRPRRGRLSRGHRAELRDAGRDPRLPDDRRRRGRHVDRPGDDPRAPLRPARRRGLGDHQPRRGHDRRAASPRADAARGARPAPAT